MSGQRLKGQEVGLVLTRGNILEDTLTAVVDFNWTWQSEIKSQGYLGEKFNRKDSTYMGVKGDLAFHSFSERWLRMVLGLIAFQQRKDPNLVVNISATLNYPNGDRPMITIPAVVFGEIPVTVSGRADYVGKKLSFEGETADVAFSQL